MLTYITLGIFALAFALIVFEVFDISITALAGALLMIIIGVISPEEAIAAIDFSTILLLMGMMIIVHIASKSGVFDWINVKIVSLTKGNPLALFLFFSLATGVISAFLDNVTTVILIVPLTIALVKGMGKDPKPYIFAEIFFANIGGALTLIGDPSNILIGGAGKLTFLQFMQNLWIPVLAVSIFVIMVFLILKRKSLKPISGNLVDLSIANLMIKKIQHDFVKATISKKFVAKVVTILLLTILCFFLQPWLGVPTHVIAFTGAIVLTILTVKQVSIHKSLESVEWSTLLFFSGLFIMVAAVENTGVLEIVSTWIANSTSNLLYLSLIILWACGLISSVLNTVPFITLMIPIIIGVQTQLPGNEDIVLWWALSMGACLGGIGTLVGGSANVVTAGLCKRHGINITFIEYAKFAMPIVIGILSICSAYLYFRLI